MSEEPKCWSISYFYPSPNSEPIIGKIYLDEEEARADWEQAKKDYQSGKCDSSPTLDYHALAPAKPRTCDACRHWVVKVPEPMQLGSVKLFAYGECQQATHYPDKGTETRIADQGHIRCGPKFGCVHWEAKPPPVA